MPCTTISVRKPLSGARAQALTDAVHSALVDALKVPEHDRFVRIVTYAPEHFVVPAGSTEDYTLVEVELFPGRTLDAKRTLYRLLVERLGVLGIPATDTRFILHEIPPENWGLRGGIAGTDL